MVKTTSQLNQFHASCPDGCATRHIYAPDQASEEAIDLFTSRQPDTKQLLPPPFLVPAVIDALRESREYSHLVHQIPGEADAFCARHVADKGQGIILTSDSDLLVHDLAGGRVVFLRDINVPAARGAACQASVYDPQAICQRLGDVELRRLGYEVYRSPQSTIPQLVRDCSQPMSDLISKDYDEFCQQYLHDETESSFVGSHLPVDQLDPRLSELAIQFRTNADTAPDTPARMFLPVLIESPLRGSAWEPSTEVRQIAYTVLRWLIPGPVSSVHEYRRVQAQQQKGKTVDVLAKDAASEAIAGLVQHITHVKTRVQGDKTWWILALTHDMHTCEEADKKSHSLRVIEQLGKRKTPTVNKVSWDIIHLAAQLQAFHYSLRMLRQVLHLVPEPELSSEAQGLRVQLAHVPPFTVFPQMQEVSVFLDSLLGSETLDTMRTFVTIPDPAAASSASSKKRKKKRGQPAPAQKKTTQQQRGGNPFSLLADE